MSGHSQSVYPSLLESPTTTDGVLTLKIIAASLAGGH